MPTLEASVLNTGLYDFSNENDFSEFPPLKWNGMSNSIQGCPVTGQPREHVRTWPPPAELTCSSSHRALLAVMVTYCLVHAHSECALREGNLRSTDFEKRKIISTKMIVILLIYLKMLFIKSVNCINLI